MYYEINENAARRAKEANSYSDYQEGTATSGYKSAVDEVVEIAERQKKLALVYPYERSQFCGMVTWAYDGPGQAVSPEEYDNLVEMLFEGQKFFAIPGWKQYLTGVFGDYMQLPPEEERITHELEAYWL